MDGRTLADKVFAALGQLIVHAGGIHPSISTRVARQNIVSSEPLRARVRG
jgi:hypothetical protein